MPALVICNGFIQLLLSGLEVALGRMKIRLLVHLCGRGRGKTRMRALVGIIIQKVGKVSDIIARGGCRRWLGISW